MTFVNLDPSLEAQFRRDLKVEAGDQFEFINLQRDIDRLRERLHGSGLFESRVRTRRIDSEDGRSVAIEYRVDLGPRTFLEVRGVDLPASERAALENAWTSSVFDQFLIDDPPTASAATCSPRANSPRSWSARGSRRRREALRIDVTPARRSPRGRSFAATAARHRALKSRR